MERRRKGMNLKFLSAVVTFSLGCSALGSAQKPNKISLRDGEAKVRQILAERAAKEGKTAHAAPAASSQTLTYWSGTIQHEGYTFPFTMLGTDPKKGSATTVIQVYVVPVKIVLPDGSVWDPATVSVTNRKDAIDGTIKSPIFGKTTWTNSGVNLGHTQYTDAFQRGSFWRDLGDDRDYHVLFQPVVQPEVEWDVPANLGAQTPGAFNGGNLADVDIIWFDAQQNAYIANSGVPADVLPFFLTYNTCEGQFDGIELSGCFAGAYHSTTLSNQPYLNAPWEGFAPDVLILSHELGETLGDPFTNNQSPCFFDTNMEVGDPVQPFQMSLRFEGRTYTVEDLVFFDWFTANYPALHSVNHGYTFEGSYLYPCSGTLSKSALIQLVGPPPAAK
jgi:hypothetical protein